MKFTCLLTLVSVFLFQTSFAGNPYPITYSLSSMKVAAKSEQMRIGEEIGSSCEKAKRIKVTGAVLTAVGPTVLIAGAVMTRFGVGMIVGDNGDEGAVAGLGLVAGGVLGIIGGSVMTGVGIPMLIHGVKRVKQKCHGDAPDTIYITPKGNGVGLAYKF